MALIFYPHQDDLSSSSIQEKLDALLEGAERYKAVILDTKKNTDSDSTKRMAPSDMTYSFNWDELAKLLREIRDHSESNSANRLAKAENLKKLAEIYEVLRGAKMPKLEAVRLALVNEANQLRSGNSTSAA